MIQKRKNSKLPVSPAPGYNPVIQTNPAERAFRVKTKRTEKQARRNKRMQKKKRRIANRLRGRDWEAQDKPMLGASPSQYEESDKTRAMNVGGIGAIHNLAQRLKLIEAIDRQLRLLKVHLPYHESDHVLNIAYNVLSGGTCLEDIEVRRNDEVFLNSLNAQRIPDPTTAADFCRRFEEDHVQVLQDVFNEARLRVWAQQPSDFFEEAIIDVDGTLVPSTGECKEGMDFSYKGDWGYHPLVVSLANTREPLFLVNRSGNRTSEEGAAEYIDKAIELCRRAGFRKITVRGDTAFSQTCHLDRWHKQGVQFVFGFDARANLVEIAEDLPKSHWRRLRRPNKYEPETDPRTRPENVKERRVVEREYKNIRLKSEEIAEFQYRPVQCQQEYWMVVVKKNLSVERGEYVLFDDVRYFYYITNRERDSAEQIVFSANARCEQENLIEQLKNGVRALHAPVDNLVSNWAYMVMASLAWSLKAWFALILPETGRWSEKYKEEKSSVLRMEFRTFLNHFMLITAQVIRTGRRIVFRLLGWNQYRHIFLRGVEILEMPLRC